MVGRFGMSDEIGFVSVLPQDGDGWGAYGSSQVSERTRQRVDDEVKRVVDGARDEAIRLVSENRDRLDGIAEALLREETLDQPQAYAAAGLASPEDEAAPVEAALPAAI
jgi:cell division protease FtsH